MKKYLIRHPSKMGDGTNDVATLQDVVSLAIAKAGGQSALAREITRRYGVKVSPQAIQYLARKSGAKRAASTSVLPYLLDIAGVSPTWAPARTFTPTYQTSGPSKKDDPQAIDFARDLANIAAAWATVPARDRKRFKKAIEDLAYKY